MQSSFKDEGFLSDASKEQASTFPNQFPEWCALYHDVNRFVQHLRTDLLKGPNDGKMHLAEVCLHRAATSFQALYLLVERGIEIDSKALLRSFLENLYVLVASRKDYPFVLDYIVTDLKKGIKSLEKMRAAIDPADTETLKRYDNTLKTMQDDCDALNPNWTNKNKVEISQLAVKAGMEKIHDGIYSYLCKFSHFSPIGATGTLYNEDLPNKKYTYHIGAKYDDSEFTLHFAIEKMLAITLNVLEMSNLLPNPEVNELLKCYRALDGHL